MKTLTPGEIAKYCDVHQRTVSRWIASGQLKGFQLPGRGNYRVVLDDFLLFLQQQQMPVPPQLESQQRILIVDDDPSYRRAISRVLNHAGYEVIAANDGFQAGALLLEQSPPLLILDLQMPGLDGYDVLRFIRQRPSLHQLKVLVISGLAQDQLNQALELGANQVLAKPFENDLLLRTVAELIQ